MSIASTDLKICDAVNEPTDDTSPAGGAIDLTSRPSLTQFSAPAKCVIVSDGADTRSVPIRGRLTTGSIATETLTANGATEQQSTNTYERMLRVGVATTDAARTISVKQGPGGTVVATIPPNEKTTRVAFDSSSSGASAVDRYEKYFAINNHGTLALLNAFLVLTADPQAVMMIGVAPSVNDTATMANRLTPPASVTFVDDNVSVGVPGTDLAPGAKIGFYGKQSLGINAAAAKSSFTVQVGGNST